MNRFPSLLATLRVAVPMCLAALREQTRKQDEKRRREAWRP